MLLTRLGCGAVVMVDIPIVDPFPLVELQPIACCCDGCCEIELDVVVITVVWAFVRLVRRRVALVPSCWEIVGLCACVPAMLLACLTVLIYFEFKTDMCQSWFYVFYTEKPHIISTIKPIASSMPPSGCVSSTKHFLSFSIRLTVFYSSFLYAEYIVNTALLFHQLYGMEKRIYFVYFFLLLIKTIPSI